MISVAIHRKESLKRYNSTLTRLLTVNHLLRPARPGQAGAASTSKPTALVRSHSLGSAWWSCSRALLLSFLFTPPALDFYEVPELGFGTPLVAFESFGVTQLLHLWNLLYTWLGVVPFNPAYVAWAHCLSSVRSGCSPRAMGAFG